MSACKSLAKNFLILNFYISFVIGSTTITTACYGLVSSSLTISCEVDPQITLVTITSPGGSNAAFCTAPLPILATACNPIGSYTTVATKVGNVTTFVLTIPSLDISTHDGNWTCNHRTENSTGKVCVNAPLFPQGKEPTFTATSNSAKSISFNGEVYCQHPVSAITFELLYAEENNAYTVLTPQISVSKQDLGSNGCDSEESNVTFSATVSCDNYGSLAGKTFTLMARFNQSNLPPGMNTYNVTSSGSFSCPDVETTTEASTSQTTTELVTTSTESLTTTQPETTSTDSVSTTSKSVTTSTESLTTTQPETTSTDSVSTTSKSVTTSTESLTTTQPEITSTDSVSTISKSETTTKSYTGSIVTEGDLTTNNPTTTPAADGSSVMTTVGHTSNIKLSGLSRDEIIAIGSIVGFFIILFIVAIVTYVVYNRIRNNKNTKDERENQEQYLKHQGQMNRHEYRFNDYNTRGYLYGQEYNLKQERGDRYRAEGGDPNKRQKMMTTRSYTTYQQPRGHDYNHYKSANTVSTYYPRMYGESHNYGFDMEMSPYIESFQYYTGSTHGSYYNHQKPERSGGRHHGRYQERQDRPYAATSNYYYPNGQYYYQYQ